MKSKVLYFTTGIILVSMGLLFNWSAVRDGHWAPTRLVTHDSATFVLTATSYHKGLGHPYKDYWEYRPPGFYLLIDTWTQLLGTEMISFRIYESLFRFLAGIGILYLFYYLFPPFKAFVSSSLLIFTIFSPVFGRWLFPESPAIFFSLLGLIILVRDTHRFGSLFLSALFFSTATQLKDTFGGSLLTLIVPLLVLGISTNFRSLVKGAICVFLGFIIPVSISYFYLINLGSLKAYSEVLAYKSSAYNGYIWQDIFLFLGRYYRSLRILKEGVTYFHYHILIILGILSLFVFFVFIIRKIKVKRQKTINKTLILETGTFKIRLTKNLINYSMVVIYALGSYIGPSMMFTFSPHYYYSTIIPTYLLWTIIAYLFYKTFTAVSVKLRHNVIFLIIIFFLLLPGDLVVSQYQASLSDPKTLVTRVLGNVSDSDMDTPVEKYIASKTKPDECILSVYGWGSAETYLYSERKPCTRFVIPTLVGAPWQAEEYRNSILSNPPQAIIYSHAGADMNVENFEEKVINLPSIISACYQQDTKYTNNGRISIKLYFPRSKGGDLKSCLIKTIGNNPSYK